MSKDEPKDTRHVAGGVKPLFPLIDPGEFSKISNRNLEVTTRTARACFDGAIRLNQEIMNFASSRIKKDLSTVNKMMTSKTSEQAFRCQTEFLENAIREYAKETSKILQLTADVAHETLSPVEERTQEVLRSIDEHGEKIE